MSREKHTSSKVDSNEAKQGYGSKGLPKHPPEVEEKMAKRAMEIGDAAAAREFGESAANIRRYRKKLLKRDGPTDSGPGRSRYSLDRSNGHSGSELDRLKQENEDLRQVVVKLTLQLERVLKRT